MYVKEQVRYVLSDATTPEALVEQLAEELVLLRDASPEQIDTTLIIHPDVLTDFLDYNDFLDNADAAIEALDLQGILQVASFHPDYQFEGTAPGDITNYSNRSPYPTLHLLRESSIDQAVQAARAAFNGPWGRVVRWRCRCRRIRDLHHCRRWRNVGSCTGCKYPKSFGFRSNN